MTNTRPAFGNWKLWMLNAYKHSSKLSYTRFRISKAYNRKVRDRTFEKGDLVLAVRRPMVMTHKTKGKFQAKWEGPFVVESVYSNGAYRRANANVDIIMMPINDKFLKRYYP